MTDGTDFSKSAERGGPALRLVITDPIVQGPAVPDNMAVVSGGAWMEAARAEHDAVTSKTTPHLVIADSLEDEGMRARRSEMLMGF